MKISVSIPGSLRQQLADHEQTAGDAGLPDTIGRLLAVIAGVDPEVLALVEAHRGSSSPAMVLEWGIRLWHEELQP
ncbi:MAG: hypothetical protein GY719_26285 [bacterium]|nr:hypothetical protein [bacterium]